MLVLAAQTEKLFGQADQGQRELPRFGTNFVRVSVEFFP
jgi:hypothetical protein